MRLGALPNNRNVLRSAATFQGDIVGDGTMQEKWKPITGYEGIYSISTYGRVRSHRRKIILTLEKMKLGYERAGLNYKGKRERILVHVLVATEFIKKPEWATEVNHIDGIKDNNYTNNLEWSTRSKNLLHAFEIGLITPLRGSKNPISKLTEKDVIEIKNALKTPYPRINIDLGKKYGVVPEAIMAIKSGKNWKHI